MTPLFGRAGIVRV